MLDARSQIAALTQQQEKHIDRQIPTGSNPIIQYFTGKHEVVRVDTEIGEVSARHLTRHSLGSPEGVAIKNKIWISIKPHQPLHFHKAQEEVTTLLRFFEVILGRRQNLLETRLWTGIPPLGSQYEVFWSHPWCRKTSGRQRPHPGDVLLDPVSDPETFGLVLRNWLSLDEVRKNARLRFSSSFSKESHFGINRLIASANAFDILLPPAVPIEVSISQALSDATAECRKIFKELPDSPERLSVLIALGRIGESNLKRKIRHRAAYLTTAIGDRLPDIERVVDEAVNCRNYFVHGGRAKLDYSKNFDVFVFLTETLEFVFAASELVECGWDIKAWKTHKSGFTNPIGRYIINYNLHLSMLKMLLPQPKT